MTGGDIRDRATERTEEYGVVAARRSVHPGACLTTALDDGIVSFLATGDGDRVRSFCQTDGVAFRPAREQQARHGAALDPRRLAQRVQTSPDMNGPQWDDRFERLEALVRAESAETRALLDARTADARSLIDERPGGLRSLIDERTDQINDRVDREAAETREFVDLRASEARTHLDAVAERLEDKIQTIAEGYGALREDVEGLKAGQARLEAGLARVDLLMMAFKQGRAG